MLKRIIRNKENNVKKPKLTILGAAIVLSAIANGQAEVPKKVKKSKSNHGIIYKIQDRTTDQSSVSDGSRSERASK